MQYDEILGLPTKTIFFELLRKHSAFDQERVTLERLRFGDALVSNGHSRNSRCFAYPEAGSGLVNPIEVFYDRISLSKLADVTEDYRWPILLKAPDDGLITNADLLDKIAHTYGLLLNAGDVVISAIDKTCYPWEVAIEAKEGNPVWTDVLPVAIFTSDNDLKQIIRSDTLNSLYYPSDALTKAQAPILSFNWVVASEELPEAPSGTVLAEGQAFTTAVLELLNRYKFGIQGELEGHPTGRWIVAPIGSAFNLAGSVVVDPETTVLRFPLRHDLKKVLVIQLGEKCTLLGGCITLYEHN